jgi:hypothetical protein
MHSLKTFIKLLGAGDKTAECISESAATLLQDDKFLLLHIRRPRSDRGVYGSSCWRLSKEKLFHWSTQFLASCDEFLPDMEHEEGETLCRWAYQLLTGASNDPFNMFDTQVKLTFFLGLYGQLETLDALDLVCFLFSTLVREVVYLDEN